MRKNDLLRLLVQLLAGALVGLTLLCVMIAIAAFNFGATETGGCFLSVSILLFLVSIFIISKLIN